MFLLNPYNTYIVMNKQYVSYYFFQRNKKLMHIKAENLFIQVLKDEMKKKGEALDLFYSFLGISSDTYFDYDRNRIQTV